MIGFNLRIDDSIKCNKFNVLRYNLFDISIISNKQLPPYLGCLIKCPKVNKEFNSYFLTSHKRHFYVYAKMKQR